MLRKLMKYEIKATGRILLPLYGALIIFALINKIFIGTNLKGSNMSFLNGIPAVISIFTYGCIMAAVFIMTFVITIQRFYKNLLGDEGYLMNTLPVPLWKNIVSKLSVSILWNFVSGIVALLSIIIMGFTADIFGEIFNELPQLLSHLFNNYGIDVVIVPVELILAGMTSLAVGTTMLYASISIGHLASKRRILSSFGAFIALEMISYTVVAIIGVNMPINYFDFGIHGALWLSILVSSIGIAIYFSITRYILRNKLNLE